MPLPKIVRDLVQTDFTIPFGNDKEGNPVAVTVDPTDAEAAEKALTVLSDFGDKNPGIVEYTALFRALITHITIIHPATKVRTTFPVAPLSKSESVKICRGAGLLGLSTALYSLTRLMGVGAITPAPESEEQADPLVGAASTSR